MILNRSIRCARRNQQGYVLLTLLFMVTLLIISFSVAASTISFQIKRDREEELVHRGVQYSRAIRNYYKKYQRYPVRLEDLENTNNLRYLRKRYKDPITGKDFKLLHFGEVKLTFSAPLAGATPVSGLTSINGSGSSNSFGGQSSTISSQFGNGSGFGNPNGFAATRNAGSTDSSQSADSNASSQNPQESTSKPDEQSGSSSGDKLSGQVFGGGPIVGVASSSKEKTIREFNKKRKYNEWQFIYDPATDRGGLLMTPNQPQLQGFANQQNVNQQQNNSSPFGNSSGFGNSNNPNSMTPVGPGTTPPPASAQPQQQ